MVEPLVVALDAVLVSSEQEERIVSAAMPAAMCFIPLLSEVTGKNWKRALRYSQRRIPLLPYATGEAASRGLKRT